MDTTEPAPTAGSYIAVVETDAGDLEATVVGFDTDGHAQINVNGDPTTVRAVKGLRGVYAANLNPPALTGTQILQAIADRGCERTTGPRPREHFCIAGTFKETILATACLPCTIRYALDLGVNTPPTETKEP